MLIPVIPRSLTIIHLLYDVDTCDIKELNNNSPCYMMLVPVIPRSLTLIHLLYDIDTHDIKELNNNSPLI